MNAAIQQEKIIRSQAKKKKNSVYKLPKYRQEQPEYEYRAVSQVSMQKQLSQMINS